MSSTTRRRSLVLTLVVAALSLGNGRCDSFGFGTPLFHFRAPRLFQLSLPGSLAFDLRLPPLAIRNSLVVKLDGAPIPTGGLANVPGGVAGSVDAPAEGTHSLAATIDVKRAVLLSHHAHGGHRLRHRRSRESRRVRDPERRRVPAAVSRPRASSSRSAARRRPATASRCPAAGMPELIGAPISTAPLDALDGFSPTVQILMHFPAGVDLDASRAPRLLEARCCGQSSTPPLEDVRTLDARSLDADSPTVLLDADTGERVLHWVELDARAAGNPARQVLFLRPGKSLTPGHRYIVAVRNLVDPLGEPVKPELAFRALRDRLPSTIPALEARRASFEDIFERLRHAGVWRHELTLAFDFVVRSDEQLTSTMLALRDDALAYADAIPAGDASGGDAQRGLQREPRERLRRARAEDLAAGEGDLPGAVLPDRSDQRSHRRSGAEPRRERPAGAQWHAALQLRLRDPVQRLRSRRDAAAAAASATVCSATARARSRASAGRAGSRASWPGRSRTSPAPPTGAASPRSISAGCSSTSSAIRRPDISSTTSRRSRRG